MTKMVAVGETDGSRVKARLDTAGPRPHRGKLVLPDPVLMHERTGRLGGSWVTSFGWVLLSIVLGLALLFGVTLLVGIPLGFVAEMRGENALLEAATTLEDIAPGNGYAFVMLALVGIGFAVPVLVLGKLLRGRWLVARRRGSTRGRGG